MENKRGHKPLHTAKYAAGMMPRLIQKLRDEEDVYTTFIYALAIYKLTHKLTYQQLDREVRLCFMQRINKLRQETNLSDKQWEVLDNIKQDMDSITTENLYKIHKRLLQLEQEAGRQI